MTKVATFASAFILLAAPVLALPEDHKASANYTLRMTTVTLVDMSYQGGSNTRSLQIGYRIGSEQSKFRRVVNVGDVYYAVIGNMDKEAVKNFQQMLKDLYKNWGKLKSGDSTSTTGRSNTKPGNTINITTAMYMEFDVAGSKGDTFNFSLSESSEGVKKQKKVKVGKVRYQVAGKIQKKTVKLIDKYLDILCKNWEGLEEAPVSKVSNGKDPRRVDSD